jgi:hypothetical protein
MENIKMTEEQMQEDRFVASNEGMTIEKPYFQQNPEWFYYDEKKGILSLTDKAPQEAYASYEQWVNEFKGAYKEQEEQEEQSQAMNLFGLQGGQNNGMQQ